jgi:hypothetical protein
MDFFFVEWLWCTVKYENVYLKGYEDMKQFKEGLKEYFEFYNHKQPHIFHLKGEHSRRLLFRGVFDGQRTFLDTDSGETLQYPLSVGED